MHVTLALSFFMPVVMMLMHVLLPCRPFRETARLLREQDPDEQVHSESADFDAVPSQKPQSQSSHQTYEVQHIKHPACIK
jgi:hypothetical protein